MAFENTPQMFLFLAGTEDIKGHFVGWEMGHCAHHPQNPQGDQQHGECLYISPETCQEISLIEKVIPG